MSRYSRIGAAFAAVLMTLVAALVLAGCGSTTGSASSSPAATQSGAAGSAAPTTYLGQAQAILSDVGTAASGLPDAVAGISGTSVADTAWIDSGNQLNDIALKLEGDASSLAALTPPNAALQPVQDAVAKGIKGVSAAVKHLADLVYEESTTEAEVNGPIPSQVAGFKAKLLALSSKLSAALSALGGASASPAP
jgi:hypothetical protein